jgi:hypothetical protein
MNIETNNQLHFVNIKTHHISNANVIGFITSNFIDLVFLQVRLNFTFYHVENCVRIDLKWYTLNLLVNFLIFVDIFGYDYIIDHL